MRMFNSKACHKVCFEGIKWIVIYLCIYLVNAHHNIRRDTYCMYDTLLLSIVLIVV